MTEVKTSFKEDICPIKKQHLHELADEYDVSAERIRQIENGALKKLKASMVSAA